MSTFQVPQFIDQKPKIVGPLTLSQFFYIAIAAGVVFVSFYIFNLVLWVFISLVAVVLGVGFAFIKVNGQDMPKVVRSGLHFFLQPKIYTWQREIQKSVYDGGGEGVETIRKNIGIQEKLNSVVLNVTTGKLFSPKQLRNEQKKDEYQVATFITGEKRKIKRVDY